MCRPSCCQPSHEGPGLAAVAVIAGAAFAYAKIGPAVARVWHIVTVALIIFTLTAASAVAAIVVTWVTARIIRGRRVDRQALLHPVPPLAEPWTVQADSAPGCLACGGTGTVLRAIAGTGYRADPCPVCDPADRAG